MRAIDSSLRWQILVASSPNLFPPGFQTLRSCRKIARHCNIKNRFDSDVEVFLVNLETYHQGNAAFKAGDFQAAIDNYTAAILSDSNNATFLLNRAAAYLKVGKYVHLLRAFLIQ